ncbi:EAL domain-containing protein [Sulfurimonas sp. C5]|uniref:EAL domain-containing protein n=1 Tax=Sulfurimonas sp. C5 TaxID=3036947 RepID=UPI0024542008|nr:EAL domain-containing protein [Sulfurimonas sp. C5]MDH4943842.1 EAL domain-containing protein [Sulfurimonas sp. C5]
MKTLRHIDFISILLVLFVFLLLFIFYSMYKIQEGVENYHNNHDRIVNMQLLNKGFDDFASSQNELVNYYQINQDIEKFRSLFIKLQETVKAHHPEEDALLTQLEWIRKLFEEKVNDLEYYKSLNSSLLSGYHFLFDLQRSISESKDISANTKSIVNETLFLLFQYSRGNYIEREYVENKLDDIHHVMRKNKNLLIENFYKQSKVSLDTISSFRQISNTIKESTIDKHLHSLKLYLHNRYDYYILGQQLIATFFFIATIVISIILFFLYLRSNKNQKELRAFNYAIQHSDNSVMMTDSDKNIVFVNEVFEKTTGYTEEEVLGKNPRILKSNLQDERIYKEMYKKLERGESWEGELINRRKDGSLFYERASIMPVFLNKKLINYLAIKLDITKYIEQNNILRQAASVFENTEEAIIIADANANVVSVNQAFTKMYGYTIDEVLGKDLSILHSGIQDTNFYQRMWDEIDHKDVFKGKIVNTTKDGDILPVWVTIKAVRDQSKRIVNYTAVQTDLRAIETSEAKADYLAYHDPLTSLYNRVSFEEFLSNALLMAKRNKEKFAVLFIDLDRFKIINDTLGHDIGDQVLIHVSKRLKHILRESDFIARWGGDEFVVILHDVASESLVATVARKIIDELKAPINVKHHSFSITASVGISMYPENGDDTKSLIKNADSAMYSAKDSGKNNFCFYTDQLSLQTEERLIIDTALHNALDNNEITMVFQPQYSIANREIISVEALVRWENEKLGVVSPEKFIPIAEDNGFIVELGYFIFEESCKRFKEMQKAGLSLQRVAINVSSIQFREPGLLEALLSIVKRYEMDPSEVEIEITERFLMDNTESNIKNLQSFRLEGFKVSIDDFGTGYSSMSYLKQLPIDTIKIDKSFIDDISQKSSDNAIVKAIIVLAKTLNYSVVAEGIETKEQEEFLRQNRCDIGQGFFFSEPLQVNELIEKFK